MRKREGERESEGDTHKYRHMEIAKRIQREREGEREIERDRVGGMEVGERDRCR